MGNFQCNSIDRKVQIKRLLHSIEVKNDNHELNNLENNLLFENELLMFALSKKKNQKINKIMNSYNNSKFHSQMNIEQLNPILIDFLEYELNEKNNKYLEKRIKYIDKWLQMIKLGYLDFKKIKNSDQINGNNNTDSNLKQNTISNYLKIFYKNYTNQFTSKISKNPPLSLRFISWRVIHNFRMDLTDYNKLLTFPLEKDVEICIRKDIYRTFPENDKEKEEKLYRVLRVFSIIDKEINYCQGMNFMAGFLLILSNYDEVETLSIFLSLFMKNSNLLRGFYLDGFSTLKLYSFLFEKYLEKNQPKIFRKLKSLDLPCEIWVRPWFLCFFSVNLPLIFAVRVWDCILAYGLEFLIIFAYCYMKNFKEEILLSEDPGQILQTFRNLVEHALQSLPISNINFDFDKVMCESLELLGEKYQCELDSFKQEYNNLKSSTSSNTKLNEFNYETEIKKLLEEANTNTMVLNTKTVSADYVFQQDDKNRILDKKIKTAFHPIQIEMICLKLKLEDYFPNEKFDVNLENSEDSKIKLPKRTFIKNPFYEE